MSQVPGGDFGYHLADFLRIGQVFYKDEGKVLAEVKSCDPPPSNRDELFRMPVLSSTIGLSPKKAPLPAPQPFVGEPCALLAVEPRKELEVLKLQKEEADDDADYLLGSQEPRDQLPGKVGLAVRPPEEPIEEKLVERLGAALCDGEAEISVAAAATKVSSLNPDIVVSEPDRISEGATPALTFDIRGVRRKRDASLSNEGPSKSRRLTEPAPSCSTSNVPKANGRLEVGNGAMVRSEVDRSNIDCMHEVVNGPTGGLSSQMNRSGDLDSNLLSSSGSKRKKKKRVRNLDLTISENRSEAVKGELPGVQDKQGMCDYKNENKEDTGLATGSAVEASGIVGLEVGREEKLDSVPCGSGVSPALLPKKKKKKRRKQKPELNQELKAERKSSKKRTKNCNITPVVSASLNHELEESDKEHEQENGQRTYLTSALVDSGHQLDASTIIPNHSQHVDNNEEVDNRPVKDVENKKRGKKLKKKDSTAVSVDAGNQKGSQNSGMPSLINLFKDGASENQTPRREAQELTETPAEGMIRNVVELAEIDDNVLLPRTNLLSNFDDVETSTSHKGGSGASPHIQAAKVGFVESQEAPNLSK